MHFYLILKCYYNDEVTQFDGNNNKKNQCNLFQVQLWPPFISPHCCILLLFLEWGEKRRHWGESMGVTGYSAKELQFGASFTEGWKMTTGIEEDCKMWSKLDPNTFQPFRTLLNRLALSKCLLSTCLGRP